MATSAETPHRAYTLPNETPTARGSDAWVDFGASRRSLRGVPSAPVAPWPERIMQPCNCLSPDLVGYQECTSSGSEFAEFAG